MPLAGRLLPPVLPHLFIQVVSSQHHCGPFHSPQHELFIASTAQERKELSASLVPGGVRAARNTTATSGRMGHGTGRLPHVSLGDHHNGME